METITIKKIGIKKIGNSWFFLVPSDYINHGDINPKNKYNITIEV